MRYNLEVRASRPETVLKALLKALHRDPEDVEEVEMSPGGGVRLKLRSGLAVRSGVHVPQQAPKPAETRKAVDYFNMPPRHFAPESQ